MINTIADRFRDIASGKNTDSSDEYYTLYPAFAAAFIELLCRYKAGKAYKVIVCPCDGPKSIFRELENKKDWIGNPRIIYSYWPEKDWKDYFDMDFQAEYGCDADEVLIFTNPPFKGLSQLLPTIRCDYILFGSNAVGLIDNVHAKETGTSLYIKNNEDYTGDASEYKEKYGRVCTLFYSNSEFMSAGKQYINKTKNKECVLFGKDRLKRIK